MRKKGVNNKIVRHEGKSLELIDSESNSCDGCYFHVGAINCEKYLKELGLTGCYRKIFKLIDDTIKIRINDLDGILCDDDLCPFKSKNCPDSSKDCIRNLIINKSRQE